MTATPFVFLIVATALLFDFANGWHDSANSIATIVSTRVFPPRFAVIWAAVFNFIAFLLFGTHVAQTIGSDLVNLQLIQFASDDVASRIAEYRGKQLKRLGRR
jgi:inorganic phosphate transporter, PiT family